MSDYPERLIPNPRNIIISESALTSHDGLWLVRHLDSGKAKFMESTHILIPSCIEIQSGHLGDLSNNLLGVFQPHDVYYGIESPYKMLYYSSWDEGSEGIIPQDGHYFKDENRGYYFIPIDRLKNSRIPYIDAQSHNTEIYHFKILHTPTKCNYWHVSIRVYDDEDNAISDMNISERQKHRRWKTVKDFLVLSIICTEIESEVTHLHPETYCKTTD